jgi:hypothetical protein
MKKLAAVGAALLCLLAGCKDPHACGPDDIDGDRDGRCHEGK